MANRFFALLLTLTLVTVLAGTTFANAMAHGPAATSVPSTVGHGHLHFEGEAAQTQIPAPHNAADHEHAPYILPVAHEKTVCLTLRDIENPCVERLSGRSPESVLRPPRA